MTFGVHCSLFVGIRLCYCCTYVYIAHFDIGFVLHNRLMPTKEPQIAQIATGEHRLLLATSFHEFWLRRVGL